LKNIPCLFINQHLSPEEKRLISDLGPFHTLANYLFGYKFPKNTKGGHFDEQWYFRVLPDYKKVIRHWLSYSPKLNKAFSLPCILFGSDKNISSRISWPINYSYGITISYFMNHLIYL